MRVLAPAKINLYLRVGPPREDGFHPLLSWMCTVELFDTLIFERARPQGLSLSCDQADLSKDQSNLVCKAAASLMEWIARPPARAADPGGIAVSLHKKIPIGAGLGGGSSDGARTLLALDRLWNLQLPHDILSHLAAQLGSDLAFFLSQPSAICTGRGEIVQPTPPPSSLYALLILPNLAMPTPAVYRQFDLMGLGSSLGTRPPFSSWAKLAALELLPNLVNDLELPAFTLRPELSNLHQRAEQYLARPVRMSGSGSTLFTLFDSEPEAQAAASRLSDQLAAQPTGQSPRQLSARLAVAALAPPLLDDLA